MEKRKEKSQNRQTAFPGIGGAGRSSGGPSSREETENTNLARFLKHALPQADKVVPEELGRLDGKHPDIKINLDGKEMVIEAKHQKASLHQAKLSAQTHAQKWLTGENRGADVAIALVYSKEYLAAGENAIENDAKIHFAIKSKENEQVGDWHWVEGTPFDLTQLIECHNGLFNKEGQNSADRAILKIRGAIEEFEERFVLSGANGKEVHKLLQQFQKDGQEEAITKNSKRMTALILLGALLFHQVLGETREDVKPLSSLKDADEIAGAWEEIQENINYVSIFEVASMLLRAGVPNIEFLKNTAISIRDDVVAGSDIMGDVYHELLEEAKTIAAFYTKRTSATMLAGICLAPELNPEIDWSDPSVVRDLKINDPACGSGTLLSAGVSKIRDNIRRELTKKLYRKHGGARSLAKKLAGIHKYMMENSIWGYDILSNAVHLTATTLGLMNPSVDYEKSKTFPMPMERGKFGNDEALGGSLEFYDTQSRVWNERQTENPETKEKKKILPPPPADFLLVNPPFVRGIGDNVSYSFLGPKDREDVTKRILKLAKENGFSTQHGLGPAFIQLGLMRVQDGGTREAQIVKDGGRLAAILPSTCAIGLEGAWEKMREAFNQEYNLEVLIVSRDPAKSKKPFFYGEAFSQNTALSECMFVAKRRHLGEKPSSEAVFIVLDENPKNNYEAMAVQDSIVKTLVDVREEKTLEGNITNGIDGSGRVKTIGKFAVLNYRDARMWGGLSFSNFELTKAAQKLRTTKRLNGIIEEVEGYNPDNFVLLDDIATPGPATIRLSVAGMIKKPTKVRFDISSSGKTDYPFYSTGYNEKMGGDGLDELTSMTDSPHGYLVPRAEFRDSCDKTFARAAQVQFTDSFSFTTLKRTATMLNEKAVGSHSIPLALDHDLESDDNNKILTLYLNSTIAILQIANTCTTTSLTKQNFSAPALKELMVPNLRSLDTKTRKKLVQVFDTIQEKGLELKSIAGLADDPVRKTIDDAISRALNIGDMDKLRRALSKENLLHGTQKKKESPKFSLTVEEKYSMITTLEDAAELLNDMGLRRLAVEAANLQQGVSAEFHPQGGENLLNVVRISNDIADKRAMAGHEGVHALFVADDTGQLRDQAIACYKKLLRDPYVSESVTRSLDMYEEESGGVLDENERQNLIIEESVAYAFEKFVRTGKVAGRPMHPVCEFIMDFYERVREIFQPERKLMRKIRDGAYGEGYHSASMKQDYPIVAELRNLLQCIGGVFSADGLSLTINREMGAKQDAAVMHV